MEEQVCTINQMQKLKELGIDTSKASMAYISKYPSCDLNDGDSIVVVSKNFNKRLYNEFGPAFTLQDILELLPYTFDNYYLKIYRGINMYYFIYESMNCEDDVIQKGDTPILAAYNMLVYIAENEWLNN